MRDVASASTSFSQAPSRLTHSARAASEMSNRTPTPTRMAFSFIADSEGHASSIGRIPMTAYSSVVTDSFPASLRRPDSEGVSSISSISDGYGHAGTSSPRAIEPRREDHRFSRVEDSGTRKSRSPPRAGPSTSRGSRAMSIENVPATPPSRIAGSGSSSFAQLSPVTPLQYIPQGKGLVGETPMYGRKLDGARKGALTPVFTPTPQPKNKGRMDVFGGMGVDDDVLRYARNEGNRPALAAI